jgi:mycoredoxin-dependent peroxiredoxin
VLEVGALAPPFALRDQHGQEQTLSARLGRRSVLLVFYPFAFTGVCTGELRALADRAKAIDDLGADLLAVSCDPLPSVRAFADGQGLDLPMLSDFWPHGEVAAAYGALDPVLGAAGRVSYVIDPAGSIRWTVRTEMTDARDVADYLRALADL